ncbi:MAG: hypothetical protein WBN83_04125 [Desulfoprunum sp.]
MEYRFLQKLPDPAGNLFFDNHKDSHQDKLRQEPEVSAPFSASVGGGPQNIQPAGLEFDAVPHLGHATDPKFFDPGSSSYLGVGRLDAGSVTVFLMKFGGLLKGPAAQKPDVLVAVAEVTALLGGKGRAIVALVAIAAEILPETGADPPFLGVVVNLKRKVPRRAGDHLTIVRKREHIETDLLVALEGALAGATNSVFFLPA